YPNMEPSLAAAADGHLHLFCRRIEPPIGFDDDAHVRGFAHLDAHVGVWFAPARELHGCDQWKWILLRDDRDALGARDPAGDLHGYDGAVLCDVGRRNHDVLAVGGVGCAEGSQRLRNGLGLETGLVPDLGPDLARAREPGCNGPCDDCRRCCQPQETPARTTHLHSLIAVLASAACT